MNSYTLVFLSLLTLIVHSSPIQENIQEPPPITASPYIQNIGRRQDVSSPIAKTIGFINGDANQAVLAPAGDFVLADVNNALWAFCPPTATASGACPLVGECVDNNLCISSEGGCFFANQGFATNTLSWYVLFLIQQMPGKY